MKNRKMRRLQKKFEYETSFNRKYLKDEFDIDDDYESKPCAYIGNKPAYLGNVIKLKAYNEISDVYDMQLEKLILENHRFVIIHHFGIKNQTLAICLLSTSSYLNEKKELGIKLSGQYNKFKDVYMDATRCWVIPSSCAKSIEYVLDDDDKFRCVLNWADNYSGKMKVIKGVFENNIVDNKIDKYIKWFSASKVTEINSYMKAINIHRYISQLSDEEVINYIFSQPKQLVDDSMMAVLRRRQLSDDPLKPVVQLAVYKDPLLAVTPDRKLLNAAMAHLMLENKEYETISKQSARGY